MITDLTLLLATLSIMAGTLVITGVPTKLGLLLVEAAGINMAAMVGMGFLFGVVLGTGLPPAPVYILVAIVIAPPFMQAGVNPWVVHFFAFFVAVFGELTPPTSITAAITSKIAGASFYVTLWRSVQICVSLFTLMVGIFIHPELVIEPGLDQMGAAYLVMVSTLGITFSAAGHLFGDARGGSRRAPGAGGHVALHPALVQRHSLGLHLRRGAGGDRLLVRLPPQAGVLTPHPRWSRSTPRRWRRAPRTRPTANKKAVVNVGP